MEGSVYRHFLDQGLCLWEWSGQEKQAWERLIWDDAKCWEGPGHAKSWEKNIVDVGSTPAKDQSNQA